MRRPVLLLGLVAALLVIPGLAGATPTFSIGATAASPNPIQPGLTMTLTTSVTNTSAEVASGIIVDEEIFDAAGVMVNQGTTSGHQYTPGQTLQPGETRAYQWFWTIPPTLASGTYTIKIGIFQDHWSQLYLWNNDAATFTVQGGGATIAFSIGAITADPTAIQPGQSLTVTTQVTNTGSATATGINVLLEMLDPLAGAFPGNQDGPSGETFAPGQTKTYTFAVTIPTGVRQGVYSASIGVFNASWSIRYAWKQNGQAFTVGTVVDPTFTITATSVSPETVAHGQEITVSTQVTDTNQPALDLKVSVEIRNADDVKVLQQYSDSQVFAVGQSRQYVYIFPIPTTLPMGEYTVNVGVYSVTWQLYTFGYHLAAFTVSGSDPGLSTLTVLRAGTGQGTVASAPAGIDCGTTCAAPYGAGGTLVTLTATPAAGSMFEGWNGGGCSGTGACTVILHADTTVTATFVPALLPSLGLVLNQSLFRTGNALDATVNLTYAGSPRPVDAYLAVLLPAEVGPGLGCPGGDAIAFVADGFTRVVVTCLSSPVASYVPLFRGVSLPEAPSGLTLAGFWHFVWSPGLPAGSYTVVLALTVPDALKDGQLAPADLLALASAGLTFAP
jgi:hypothetical protein